MDHWFSKKLLIKCTRNVLVACVLVSSVFFIYAWKRLSYDKLSVPEFGCEICIEPGTSLRQFTNQLHSRNILEHPRLLRWYGVITNRANNIKAGEYKIEAGMTPKDILRKVVAGEVNNYAFTVIEGMQTLHILAELQQHPKIKATLNGLTPDQIIAELDLPIAHLEGLFLPDTYFFEAGTTDVDFLRRAYYSMDQKLQALWLDRDPECVLDTPYEALILASIIEKESGLKSEYPEISGVYQRRLMAGMRLQADPTVIYALQDQLNGPLLKLHLRIDSPYNTYKLAGLPPTPIALPSLAAIEAALHPAPGDSLYFVATGTGGHLFSKSLEEHNKAVQQVRR
jgi:UPF0755 protein